MSILRKITFTGLMLAVCGLAYATMVGPTHELESTTIEQAELTSAPLDADAVSVLVASDAVGGRIHQATNGPGSSTNYNVQLIRQWTFNHSCWIPRPPGR